MTAAVVMNKRVTIVIVSFKTINRCPHVITHLREVTYRNNSFIIFKFHKLSKH